MSWRARRCCQRESNFLAGALSQGQVQVSWQTQRFSKVDRWIDTLVDRARKVDGEKARKKEQRRTK